MKLSDFFKKSEDLIAVDIGSNTLKLVEFDVSLEKPKLVTLAIAPLSPDIFSNNILVKPDKVAEQVTSLLETHAVEDKRVVVAVPGPSVFTKRVKMQKVPMAELANAIQYEAGNFIPHSIDAVKLDFHVIGEFGKNQLDVLVMAAKNEIVDSFLNALSLSGLQTAIVDVDFFALQNVFELSYPELLEKTVALVNIGERYSSINICRGGNPLFTGDIGVGGKVLTDALAETFGLSYADAEKAKKTKQVASLNDSQVVSDSIKEIIAKNIEFIATEFNRQLSFFWNASGADEGIDTIMLAGGGSSTEGLSEELSEKTGIKCEVLDPLRGIEFGEKVDEKLLKESKSSLSVVIGLGIRRLGDKVTPEYDS